MHYKVKNYCKTTLEAGELLVKVNISVNKCAMKA